MDIDSIFQPDGVQSLLDQALGRHALHIRGSDEKFREVVSWSTVNRLLTYGGLAYPRLRVINGAQELCPDAYSRIGRNGHPRLLVAELTALLRVGAILAIDAIELLDERIGDFCREIETLFGLPVTGELYCSWSDSVARSPQWDDHETLLFQIDGRKVWSLYHPTAHHPTARLQVQLPQDPPTWQETIQAGDLLYIPRGWWYQDRSVNEPSLYLAVSFVNPQGADIAVRACEKLRSNEMARMDIPRFGSADLQSHFITAFQQEIIRVVALPGMINGLIDDIQESSDPRTGFNLPWMAYDKPLPPTCHQLMLLTRFSTIEGLTRYRGSDWVDIAHNGSRLRFADTITCVLERLCRLPRPTLGDMLVDCGGKLSRERIMDHVSELILKGLVYSRARWKTERSSERTRIARARRHILYI